MSKNLPEVNKTEEVDLIQIFTVIENGFKKLGKLILSLFKGLLLILEKLGVIILIGLKVLRKYFVYIFLAGIVGYSCFLLLNKVSPPIYQSELILKQNYNTGKVLYNTIIRYSTLAQQRDSVALSNEINTSSTLAAKLISFEIADNMNKNSLFNSYNEFLKDLDSNLVFTFEEYKEQFDLENVPTQTVIAYSIDPSVFSDLSEPFMKSLENNPYFIQQKDIEIATLNAKLNSYKSMLSKSDTLQKEYLNLLKDYYVSKSPNEPSATTLTLNMANNKEKINTKEFELFEEQKELRNEIVDIERRIKDKDEIFNLESEFKPAVRVASSFEENKLWAGLLTAFLIFTYFLYKELNFSDLIEKYGSVNELLGK